ncbi:NAD(P)H-hydrate dehydratase [Metabacillus sp. 84]|uniref:NAD(P)H-hydrate dehydratase n=1 Tax=unclassified Metabacillus TaxID=2675274 RepID=UPI003CF6ADC7
MFIYTKDEIRQFDKLAEERGMDDFTLMENSGAALFREITNFISHDDKICIFAGRGNNGGDGIVLARYLLQNGYQTELVFPLGMPAEGGPSDRHWKYALASGYSFSGGQGEADILIDALLGIGFRYPLDEKVRDVIRKLNLQKGRKISIDIPSGVEADRGIADQEAFQAEMTICLHGYKPSAFLLPSLKHYGKTFIADIGLPQRGKVRLWTEKEAAAALPEMDSSAHKGTFGTGYIIAGSDHMPGSALLAAKGALRSGIGKLIVGTSETAAGIIAGQIPEATYEWDALEKAAGGELPENLKAAAIGPGLEQNDAIEHAIQTLLQKELPIVLDAGALNQREYPQRPHPVILTPHPGEFSRMTGLTGKEVQSTRLSAALNYAKENRTIVILKGMYTILAFPDGEAIINSSGSQALAKGGSGDTLTGMLLAFLCTHNGIKEAAANAVYAHGRTAELWTEKYGKRTMMASDICELIPEVMKELEERKRKEC